MKLIILVLALAILGGCTATLPNMQTRGGAFHLFQYPPNEVISEHKLIRNYDKGDIPLKNSILDCVTAFKGDTPSVVGCINNLYGAD